LGLIHLPLVTHGLRHGLYSFAASRLCSGQALRLDSCCHLSRNFLRDYSLELTDVPGAALLADPVDLKSVAGGDVVVFAADLLLQLADFRGKKFDRTAALRADHVVVAAAVVLMLVAGDAVVEGDFAGQAAFSASNFSVR
jgi:hypothetical protein